MGKSVFRAIQRHKRKMIFDSVRAAQEHGLDYEGVQQFANENYTTPKHMLKSALRSFKQEKPFVMPEPVELDDDAEPTVADEMAEEE